MAPAEGSALADTAAGSEDSLSRKRKTQTLLTEVCQRLHQRRPGQRLLIVFDQFEELIILHNIDSERVQRVREFLHSLVSSQPDGLAILLTLRSDYEDQLEELELPYQVQNRNWRKVGHFTLGQAEQFLTADGGGLRLGQELLKAVLQEAAEVDGTPGRTRPIVINILGLMLQRLHRVDPTTMDRGLLLARFVRMSIEEPDVRDASGLILKEMLQLDSGTRVPSTVKHLAAQTKLGSIEIQGCLNRLGDPERQLVRPIVVKDHGEDPQPVEERLWEISHDFIAHIHPYLSSSEWAALFSRAGGEEIDRDEVIQNAYDQWLSTHPVTEQIRGRLGKWLRGLTIILPLYLLIEAQLGRYTARQKAAIRDPRSA